MFFACAPQTAQIGDHSLRFEVDPNDTSLCYVWLEGHKAVFQRNGPLLRVDPPEGEDDEESITEREEPEAGDIPPSEGDAKPVSVGGGAAS